MNLMNMTLTFFSRFPWIEKLVSGGLWYYYVSGRRARRVLSKLKSIRFSPPVSVKMCGDTQTVLLTICTYSERYVYDFPRRAPSMSLLRVSSPNVSLGPRTTRSDKEVSR